MRDKLKRITIIALSLSLFLSTFIFLSYNDAAYAAGEDRFGVRQIYPSAPGGDVWNARWSSHPRSIYSGQRDPRDSMFRVMAHGGKLRVNGNGTATASGDIMRYYVQDPDRSWGDVEITFYGKRVNEWASAPSRAGFTIQARTGDGHRSYNQCLGRSYGATFRYWGGAGFGKEVKHPDNADIGGPPYKNIWNGGEMPKNKWIGFKFVVRNIEGGAVKLELYRDMTDGKNGGDWELIQEFTDTGRWYSSKYPNGLCGQPKYHTFIGKDPLVILRNDRSTMELKKFSIREIETVDGYAFKDSGVTTFRNTIDWLADKGITKGCNPPWNDWYCPNRSVTRGEMATFLVRALNLPKATRDYFSDDNGTTHEANINAIAQAGITTASGKYRPNDPILREEFAAFMTRALKLPQAEKDYFRDDNSSKFEDAINSLAKSRITIGCNPPENDRFCPKDPVTRGQMSAFFKRALG